TLPAAAVWSARQAANSTPLTSGWPSPDLAGGAAYAPKASAENCLATAPVSEVAARPNDLNEVACVSSARSAAACSGGGCHTFARAALKPSGAEQRFVD